VTLAGLKKSWKQHMQLRRRRLSPELGPSVNHFNSVTRPTSLNITFARDEEFE
jgi:hypothetical protein